MTEGEKPFVRSTSSIKRWTGLPKSRSLMSPFVGRSDYLLVRTLFIRFVTLFHYGRERFEPRSHFKSRLSLIVRVNVVLNRTVVVDSD